MRLPNFGKRIEKKIYFKDRGPRRSNFAIFCDFVKGFVKNGETDSCYWLYDFPHKSPDEQNEYLHYAEFRKDRNRINLKEFFSESGREHWNYLVVLRDKLIFWQFLKGMGFKTPECCYYYNFRDRSLTDIRNGQIIDPSEILHESGDFFCKAIEGECGKGIYKLRIDNGNLFANGKQVEKLDKPNASSYLIQRNVIQHDDINKIYSKSVNTIRAITIIDKHGVPQLLSAVMRFGAHGNLVDNWFQGGFVVGINDDGTLRDFGIYEFPINGEIIVNEHPDTHVKFGGISIPFYTDAVAEALRLHSFIPQIRAIGWDIAITPDGPTFIEGNDNFEISLHQTVDNGLKRKWKRLIQ